MPETGSALDGDQNQGVQTTQSGWCGSTRWIEIGLAAQEGQPGAAEAMEDLCRQYWPAVYAYIRRRGHEPAAAEDLTQSFISGFLVPKKLAGLDESKGRFRSFLLVSLKNFISNEWNRTQAQKRGGGRTEVSLDALAAEEAYCVAAPDLSPDALYDKRWALALLRQAVAHLESEEKKEGRGAAFKRLQVFLTADGLDDNYDAAGRELGLTRDAVAMAVHRLRRRFREALRKQIAATVKPEQVEEEMRCLLTALRQR